MTGMYRRNNKHKTARHPREKAPETAVLQEKTACIPYRDLL